MRHQRPAAWTQAMNIELEEKEYHHRAGRAATFCNPGFKSSWKYSNPMMKPVAGLGRRV